MGRKGRKRRKRRRRKAKKVRFDMKRSGWPTELDVKTLTNKKLTAVFTQRHRDTRDPYRKDEPGSLGRLPSHLGQSATVYELNGVAWAPATDWKRRRPFKNQYEYPTDKRTLKKLLRRWCDKYNVPRRLVLLYETGERTVPLLPVYPKYKMRKMDVKEFDKALNGGSNAKS